MVGSQFDRMQLPVLTCKALSSAGYFHPWLTKYRRGTAAMSQGIAAKIGTSASLLTPHAWAPAALCMGVVFGDIGTSPLYTLSVAAKVASPGGTVAPDAVLGIVSLIFWSLI